MHRQTEEGQARAYPSFEEWKEMAAQCCDPTAHLVPSERAAQACLKLVDPDRLNEAVSRYIDLEALSYWAQPAFERGHLLPAEVRQELSRRRPGLLKADLPAQQDSEGGSAAWQRLMTWIGEHFFQQVFQQAKDDGSFDAILIEKRIYPRSIRTEEFADHCRRLWSGVLPSPYPSFDQWRRGADAYVEGKSIDRERLG